MKTAAQSAIAFALASYVTEDTAPIATVVDTAPQKLVKVQRKASKPAPEKVEHEAQVTPKTSAPIGCPNLPAKGTLDAKGYMMAMRNAKDRDAKLAAIAGFIGYDPRQNYAEQELAANFAAKRALRPIDTSGPTLAEDRAAKRSALGFVKGLPDAHQVKVNDLLAREKMATDIMIAEQALCDKATKAGDEQGATHHAGLALLEQERLDYIQSEIHALIGDRPAPDFAKVRTSQLDEQGNSVLVGERTNKPDPSKWDGFFTKR